MWPSFILEVLTFDSQRDKGQVCHAVLSTKLVYYENHLSGGENKVTLKFLSKVFAISFPLHWRLVSWFKFDQTYSATVDIRGH